MAARVSHQSRRVSARGRFARSWDSVCSLAHRFWRSTHRWSRRVWFEVLLAYSDVQTAAVLTYARVFHRDKYELITEQMRAQDKAMML